MGAFGASGQLDLQAGERLKKIRLSKGLTPEDLGSAAGVSARTIRNIESGKQLNPTEFTRIQLATALGLSHDELWAVPEELPDPLQGAAASNGEKSSHPSATGGILEQSWPLKVGTILVVLVFLWISKGWILPPMVPDLSVEAGDLVARDPRTQEVVWRFDRDAEIHFHQPTPWNDRTVLVGLGADGEDGGGVFLLNAITGGVMWRSFLDVDHVRAAFGPESVDGARFIAVKAFFPDLDGDGQQEVVVTHMHGLWYPQSLLFLDREGRLLGQYDHRGHLYDALIVDLDRDRREEFLITGTNNAAAYQTGTLLKFDRDHLSGASLDSLAGDRSTLEDQAAVRVVFGSFGDEFLDCVELPRFQARGVRSFLDSSGESRVTVHVAGPAGGIMVLLDNELRPLSAHVNDYWAIEFGSCENILTRDRDLSLEAWLESWLGSARRFEAGHFTPFSPAP